MYFNGYTNVPVIFAFFAVTSEEHTRLWSTPSFINNQLKGEFILLDVIVEVFDTKIFHPENLSVCEGNGRCKMEWITTVERYKMASAQDFTYRKFKPFNLHRNHCTE